MPLYQEETLDGVTKYRRALAISCANPANAAPSIAFQEEDLVVMPDGARFSKFAGSINVEMSDPDLEMPLVNPLTGESLGATFTAQQLYLMLGSAYLYFASLRDNQPQG